MPVDFTWVPSYGAAAKTTPRVATLSFGDNYEQRIARGINRTPRVYTLAFNNRTCVEIDQIEAFLIARGGVTPFTYAHNGGPTRKFVSLGEWVRTNVAYNCDSLTVSFKEVP